MKLFKKIFLVFFLTLFTCILSFKVEKEVQAGSYACKIGDQNYATVQSAIDALVDNEEATITLLRDVTEAVTFSQDKKY